MKNECRFSDCRRYRYTLRHSWDERSPRRSIMWIGLNPSTADENKLDPTLRRIAAFSKAWGFTEFVMTNLFAYRATLPKDMKEQADPIGILNNRALQDAAHRSEIIVAAWGTHGSHSGRDKQVEYLLSGREIHCLARNANGTPKHPLYVAGATALQLYQPSGYLVE